MVLQKLLHFIYPGGCHVCGEAKERINHYLCPSCQTSVKLTEHLPHLQDIYCFDECIAVDVLLKHYKKNFSPHLRELLVSWMMMVFFKIDVPMPDYIVPAAAKEVALLKRNHTNKTVAASFAKMLSLPLLDLFEYRLEDEVYNEKGELLGDVHLKSSKNLQDKTLLIIQDASSDYLEYVKLLQGTGIKNLYKIALSNKQGC